LRITYMFQPPTDAFPEDIGFTMERIENTQLKGTEDSLDGAFFLFVIVIFGFGAILFM
ncbi:unnamed protein product, partial [marine sediment metagenome]